jgi:hypothetical protein
MFGFSGYSGGLTRCSGPAFQRGAIAALFALVALAIGTLPSLANASPAIPVWDLCAPLMGEGYRVRRKKS